MKKLGIIIGVLLVTIVSPFVVQFGWNEIVTTILPVGKISLTQLHIFTLMEQDERLLNKNK